MEVKENVPDKSIDTLQIQMEFCSGKGKRMLWKKNKILHVTLLLWKFLPKVQSFPTMLKNIISLLVAMQGC